MASVSKPIKLRAAKCALATARRSTSPLGWADGDLPRDPPGLGRWPDSGVGLANAWIFAADPRRRRELSDAQIDMELAMEDAVFDRAPLRPYTEV